MDDLHDNDSGDSRFTSLLGRIPTTTPRAIAGRAVGLLTARGEAERYRRAIGLLDLQLEDIVLEAGCAAGIGIAQAAEIAALGRICGVESSETLLAAARARNADAIQSGYVELHHGTISALPWPAATFDKAFAVNSPRDWPDPVESLTDIHRVIRPGGQLALLVQPPWRTKRHDVRNLAELWAHRIDEANFKNARFGLLRVGRNYVAAVTGTA